MTDAERFDKLLEIADKNDQAELKSAHNGRVTTMKAYNDKPGRDTKADYDASREMYAETLDRIWQKYFPGDAPAADGEWFKNKKAALLWIVENHGDKLVSQGKFYQDVGNGACRLHSDGKKVSRFSVLEYVLKLKQKNGGSAGSSSDPSIADRKEKAEMEKAEADARIAKAKADEAERERDEKWMLKEDSEDQAAALVGIIQDAFRHRVYLDHTLLLAACGGDSARDAEFAHALQSFCNRALNDVSNYKEIEVEFEADEEDDI